MNMGYFDLQTESKDVMLEIEQYKWLESEKTGNDIGFHNAAQQWITSHYDEWFKHHCDRYLNNE